jgi:hypothetical protein
MMADANNKPSASASLERERLLLRSQLSAQRLVIMQKLDPAPVASAARRYPRSYTMRFISEHPDAVMKLLGRALLLTLGAPALKTLMSALAFGKLFRAKS